MTTSAAIVRTSEFSGVPVQIAAAIRDASDRSGVDFAYLVKKAAVESSFRPGAKAAGSTATGLYQFVEGTWLDMVKQHGAKHGLGHYAEALETGRVTGGLRREILALRTDPRLSALMAAEYAEVNRTHLRGTVGGKIGETEVYLAHFLGPSGATQFLKARHADPTQAAAAVLPEAAKANRSVFYDAGQARSLGEVYDRIEAKLRSRAPAPTAGPPRSETPEPLPPETTPSPSEPPRPLGVQAAPPGGVAAAPFTQSAYLPAPMPTSRLAWVTQLFTSSLEPPERTEPRRTSKQD